MDITYSQAAHSWYLLSLGLSTMIISWLQNEGKGQPKESTILLGN